MDPIYAGDTSIEEVPGARLVIKRGEASQLIRPYEGDVSELVNFIASKQTGSTVDYEYPDMVLDSIEAIEDGPNAKVKLIFYGDPQGFLNPFNPTDLLSDVSWEPTSITLATTVDSDGQFLVNYYAPTITYRYCTSEVFESAQYQGYASNPKEITILNFAFASNNSNSQTSGFVPSGTWVYTVYSILTGFTRKQKGNVYNYMETWSVVLQSSIVPVSLTTPASPNNPNTQ